MNGMERKGIDGCLACRRGSRQRVLGGLEREKRLNESLGWEVLVFAIKGIKESVAGFGKKKKVKVLLGFPWVSSFA